MHFHLRNIALKNIQVGAYAQMTERNFHDKDFVQKRIDQPMIDETFTQFNNIIGFCKGYLPSRKDDLQSLFFILIYTLYGNEITYRDIL